MSRFGGLLMPLILLRSRGVRAVVSVVAVSRLLRSSCASELLLVVGVVVYSVVLVLLECPDNVPAMVVPMLWHLSWSWASSSSASSRSARDSW
eukprot:3222425-Pyramimonas_sp.AAC.1